MAHHYFAKAASMVPRRIPKFGALITDVQGTLIPSGPAEDAMRKAFTTYTSMKVTPEDIVLTGIGRPKREHIRALWSKLHRGIPPTPNILKTLDDAFELELSATLHESEKTMDFVPGAHETLSALAEQSIPCGFVTGFSRYSVIPMTTYWAKKGIVFDAFGTPDGGFCSRRWPFDLLPRAESLLGKNDNSKTKQIAALLDHWQIEPAKAIFLGDTPYDMEAGLEAKCGQVIGVTDESALQNANLDVARVLRAAGAHATISNWWPIYESIQ